MTDYQSCTTILPTNSDKKFVPKNHRIRCLVAYWIIGLCNNYGYVVMLTAANDIIIENTDEKTVGLSENKDVLQNDCGDYKYQTMIKK